MLQLDVLSSLAISGAGALVGAGMLRPQLAHDGAGAEALRLCRCAFAVIGAGLVLPVVVEAPLPPWTQAAMGYGTVAGVTMIGWAMAAMAGEPQSRTALALTLAAALAAMMAALPAGTWGLTVACTLGLAAASCLAAWMGWRLIWRPHDIHERLIGVTGLPLARRVAERMRVGLEQAPWADLLPGLVTVTASLGVTLLGANESLEKALARADEALYRAKFGGRNQVQVGLAAA